MNSERGVRCHACGATTPLPDDLRIPTFGCAFCKATLDTASYAGRAAVSADALVGHMQVAIASPMPLSEKIANAPRFEGGSRATRGEPCKRCGQALAVPLDVEIHQVTCAACGVTQNIREYISDQERFELDMQRQVAGNEALKRLQAEGAPCTQCGGKNPVPTDGSVQFVCTFCGATVLLSEHVDATAVARQRLKHGVFAMKDELIAKQKQRDRMVQLGIGGFVIFALLALAIANLLLSP